MWLPHREGQDHPEFPQRRLLACSETARQQGLAATSQPEGRECPALKHSISEAARFELHNLPSSSSSQWELHSAASGHVLREALPVAGSYVLMGKVIVLDKHLHGKLQDMRL